MPRIGRPPKCDPETWTVTDDWPDPLPVTQAEIELFEAWFNARVRRAVAGVFHYISPRHADLYFTEIGFRAEPYAELENGAKLFEPCGSGFPPARQLVAVAVGRQLRRTREGSIVIKSAVAAFG